jgi:hypothetical protein
MALAGALAALVLVERGRVRAERPVKESQPAPEAIGA